MTRALLASLLVLLALVPAAASASDVTVERAWNSQNRAFAKNDRDVRSAIRGWARSEGKRAAPLTRALRRYESLLATVERRVRRQEASSAKGRSARRLVLRSLRSLRASARSLRSGVRAVSAGRPTVARRVIRRGIRQERAGNRYGRRAASLFRAARREREAAAQQPQPQPQPGTTQPPPSNQPPPSGGGQQPPPEDGGGGGGGGDGGGGSGPLPLPGLPLPPA
jgi:hypothetical protein